MMKFLTTMVFCALLSMRLVVGLAQANAPRYLPAVQADSLMQGAILLDRDVKTAYLRASDIMFDLKHDDWLFGACQDVVRSEAKHILQLNALVERQMRLKKVVPNSDGFIWISMVDPRDGRKRWFTFDMHPDGGDGFSRLLPEDHAEVWYRLE